ncbi:dienelactone hydrolase family protein [Schumannella soli]|uniref:Dienelactone hydrolase n=1 Tax=Schumannella soli TaxID=2590779 RepID=A0A506Y9A9_9MICO|nr:alpha/beta fold hydrolase [Schumannella soli]TPW77737.1 dienelactone hydrolase [Schumannella soli]
MEELVPIPHPGVPLEFGRPGDPGVIVVHDWYGRLPWLENYAEALSRVGFRVLVPDLYDGVATVDGEQAERLLTTLTDDGVDAEIDLALEQLRGEGSTRIGVIGFSIGGWHGLRFAQTGAVDAVVAYYATLAENVHGVLPAPVLLHLAEIDEWPEGAEPGAFIARLKDDGTPIEQHAYPATRHGFANGTVGGEFDRDAAALAFARSASFLESQLAS